MPWVVVHATQRLLFLIYRLSTYMTCRAAASVLVYCHYSVTVVKPGYENGQTADAWKTLHGGDELLLNGVSTRWLTITHR